MRPDEHLPRPSTPLLLEASQRASSSFNSKEGGVKESESRGTGETEADGGWKTEVLGKQGWQRSTSSWPASEHGGNR